MSIDYFTLFNLTPAFAQDPRQIQSHFYALQQAAHPDNFVDQPASAKQSATQYAALINDAYRILRDPFKRALYLLKLQGLDILGEQNTQLPQDILLEQLELREELAQVAQQPVLLADFASKISQQLKQLESALDQLQAQTPVAETTRLLWQIQFYRKLREELS